MYLKKLSVLALAGIIMFFLFSCSKQKSLPTIPVFYTHVVDNQTATETVTQSTLTVTLTSGQTQAASSTKTLTAAIGTSTVTGTITATSSITLTNSPIFTRTDTVIIIPTATLTKTPVPVKGGASSSPAYSIINTQGNTVTIVYNSGDTNWAAAPGYGTLRITIPPDWSPPSLNNTDPGYFTVTISNGTLFSANVSGQEIILRVRSLSAYSGSITLIYGDMTDGGPGASSQLSEGVVHFFTEMTESGDITIPIDLSPSIDCVGPLGYVTGSPSVFVEGSSGNTFNFTYYPGTSWATSPGYGTLKILIPDFLAPPSMNSFDEGYFAVNVSGGTLVEEIVEGNAIIVKASGITLGGGNIRVYYGSTSGGGLGLNAPAVGTYYFKIESDRDGSTTYPAGIAVQLVVAQATATITQTSTNTDIPTMTGTITQTGTITATVTKTSAASKTSTRTRTATRTITPTKTPTPTSTVVLTSTQSMTHTISPTFTVTPTSTITDTVTQTKTVTSTFTALPSKTATKTITLTKTLTGTKTATSTATPSITPTFTVTPTFTPHTVVFIDAALDSKIREIINKPTGEILSSDVETINTLNAFSSGITDLSGIENCTGLVILSLYGNSIADITALAGLINLNYLDLNMNQITDITPLVNNADAGGFTTGSQIILDNNPLSAQAIAADIPYLQLKQIMVSK